MTVAVGNVMSVYTHTWNFVKYCELLIWILFFKDYIIIFTEKVCILLGNYIYLYMQDH